jgi:hypothetical protein
MNFLKLYHNRDLKGMASAVSRSISHIGIECFADGLERLHKRCTRLLFDGYYILPEGVELAWTGRSTLQPARRPALQKAAAIEIKPGVWLVWNRTILRLDVSGVQAEGNFSVNCAFHWVYRLRKE